MKKKSVVQPVEPAPVAAPVVPLPDPQGATVQSRMEKARKAAASRFGRAALGGGGGAAAAPKTKRPTALGAGY